MWDFSWHRTVSSSSRSSTSGGADLKHSNLSHTDIVSVSPSLMTMSRVLTPHMVSALPHDPGDHEILSWHQYHLKPTCSVHTCTHTRYHPPHSWWSPRSPPGCHFLFSRLSVLVLCHQQCMIDKVLSVSTCVSCTWCSLHSYQCLQRPRSQLDPLEIKDTKIFLIIWI